MSGARLDLVELLIAASVVLSAAHAAAPLFPRREVWVALAFGLVHGLGFAGALEGLGVDGPTLALTVFGFNLGIEVTQALLVLVTLPGSSCSRERGSGSAFASSAAPCRS